MSKAQTRTLELQSQSQLLDKLRLMTRFGSNLVTFTGARGAGKSWLLNRYFSHFVSTRYKALLLGDASWSEQDIKQAIFQQLIPNSTIDANLSLFDNLDNELGLQTTEFVILVDDASLLSEENLLLLWSLVERIQAHPTWTLSLILACGPDLLSKKVLPLSRQFNVQPAELKIEPLRQSEAEFFLELMVLRKFESLNKRDKIRKKAQRCARYPGELIALGNKVKSTKPVLPSHNGSAKSGVIITLLVILLGLIAWWLLSGSGKPSGSDPVSITSSESAESQKDTSLSGESSEVVDFSVRERETLTDDTKELPPPVTDQTVTLADNSNGRHRVVVPDEVVDSLIETESQVVKPPSNQIESVTKSEDKPTSNAINFSFAREELMEISAKRYTIQLGALRTMREVQSFLDTHQMQDDARIYPTLRSGKKWYIITYGDYRYVKLASQGIADLPQAVQEIGPWVKSMTQVHKEIEAGK
ncbi:cell division protein DamX [Vibrio inusitatus NBRC 102082]|uniref:Cell division protein DamX n=1 Tax=Vibrio inusitatus NBRC 102082 TaxID=1219070 RepID=A0A4Y3HXC4_9VIBR|nr:SPOR domain-containing protein [Vibrio inusitatus]GEA51352.1 cell division protein DamX [Vibrio inusitatus NBRC 102082]